MNKEFRTPFYGTVPTSSLPASNIIYDNSDSGINATNVKDAIDELAGKSTELSVDLLWENETPVAPFAPISVDVGDLTDYKLVIIMFKAYYSQAAISSMVCPIDIDNFVYRTNGSVNSFRTFSITDTAVSFDAAQYHGSYNNDTKTTDNAYCVPVKIYGVK